MLRLVRIATAALCCGVLWGCATPLLEIVSSDEQTVLQPMFTTRIVQEHDANTRDIVITNLPVQALRAASLEELLSMKGILVHIHQFYEPRTGRTAMDSTASNVSMRLLVLNGSGLGVYGGGGLMRTSTGVIVDDVVVCSLRGGTVRPMYMDDGFEDVLGPATIQGDFDVLLDPELTQEAVLTVRRLLMHADVQSATTQ